jgi:hypothetical protein
MQFSTKRLLGLAVVWSVDVVAFQPTPPMYTCTTATGTHTRSRGWGLPKLLMGQTRPNHDDTQQTKHNKITSKTPKSSAEAFAQSILREPEPIAGSDGMSVLMDIVDLETGEVGNVVLRNITEPFWQACIDKVNTPQMDYRVCAVGSPGIGKTTCTPVLIRMLLKQLNTVVYLIRSVEKTRFYYEFIPNANGSVATNVYPEKEGRSNIASLNSESTYYVVDPGKTKDSCDPSSTFEAKVMIVASPDSRHWGDSMFSKAFHSVMGFLKYFPVWELCELLAARTFFAESIAEEVVLQRYSEVGGVPGYIFASQIRFNAILKQQGRNINALTWEQVEKIAKIEVEPKGDLLVYMKSPNDETFKKDTVVLASPLVEQKVYTKFKKQLWAVMLTAGPEGWKIIEAIARDSMVQEKKEEFLCRPCVGKNNTLYDKTFTKMLGGCADIRLVLDMVEAAKAENNTNVLFHSVDRYQKLIDFIYRDEKGHFHAFQVTLGQTHTANENDIEDLEAQVGDPKRLSLYYMVPGNNFKTFVTMKAKPKAKCKIFHVMLPNPNSVQ